MSNVVFEYFTKTFHGCQYSQILCVHGWPIVMLYFTPQIVEYLNHSKIGGGYTQIRGGYTQIGGGYTQICGVQAGGI